jgi:hypothetical protein
MDGRGRRATLFHLDALCPQVVRCDLGQPPGLPDGIDVAIENRLAHGAGAIGTEADGRQRRAVTSTDGMTADFYPFEMKFLGETATRIINEVKGVNRVVYDVTGS